MFHFRKIEIEISTNIQFDWKIINYTAVIIHSTGYYCRNVVSTQTIVIDSLRIAFFQIFAFVVTCNTDRCWSGLPI